MSDVRKVRSKTLFAFRIHTAVLEKYRTLDEEQRKSILKQLKRSLYSMVASEGGGKV